MIKHTIYSAGGNYESSFVEYYGQDSAGNKIAIARTFNDWETVCLFINTLCEQLETHVCHWYVNE